MVDRLNMSAKAAEAQLPAPPRTCPAPLPPAAQKSALSTGDSFQCDTLPGSQYDLPAPKNKDKWDFNFRVDALHKGQKGWQRYGDLVKEVAAKQHIDPLILGAYVWNESNFNPNQDYSAQGMHAVGLGSVQAQYFPRLTVDQLKDPKRNLTMTAREFKEKWHPEQMSNTLLDVFYPAWRRKNGQIPGFKSKEEYLQLVANKLDALRHIDAELTRKREEAAARRNATLETAKRDS